MGEMIKLIAGVVTVAVLGGVFLAGAFLVQRRVLFPAPRTPSATELTSVETVRLALAAGVAEALFLPATDASGPTPLIIFTHGNAELAEHWVGRFAEAGSWGWGVLLLEYPGYGRSAGTPSEQSIFEAAAAAYDWARRDSRVDAARIVAWGRSLGGGPAAWLAANRPLAGLILESAFTSTRDLMGRYLIPGFLVRDPFDSVRALQRYRGPLLVVHGRDDRIVPVAQGRTLAAIVDGAQFHELPCGHNDCQRPWTIVQPFLGQLQSPALPEMGRQPR